MCNFPAKDLHRMRRQMAWRAEMSNDPGFIEAAMRFVMGVDTLRLAHEEADECLCWYEVIEAEAKACGIEGSPQIRKGPARARTTPEAAATTPRAVG
jgi:hypothetical protein